MNKCEILFLKFWDNVLTEEQKKLDAQTIASLAFCTAQQSVQRIAFCAGAAGFLVGVVVSLIVVSVQNGVR